MVAVTAFLLHAGTTSRGEPRYPDAPDAFTAGEAHAWKLATGAPDLIGKVPW
jgi:hypothetical protein